VLDGVSVGVEVKVVVAVTVAVHVSVAPATPSGEPVFSAGVTLSVSSAARVALVPVLPLPDSVGSWEIDLVPVFPGATDAKVVTIATDGL
jgi:hypothetical protein